MGRQIPSIPGYEFLDGYFSCIVVLKSVFLSYDQYLGPISCTESRENHHCRTRHARGAD